MKVFIEFNFNRSTFNMYSPSTINKEIIDLINQIDITTDRIKLIKFRLADVNENVKHEMRPNIMKYIRDPMSETEVTTKSMQMVADWNGQEHQWALIALRCIESDQYIGIVCFRYESIENDTVEIGWRLGTEHQGKGLATEASTALINFIKKYIKPHKIVAYCVAKNTGSSNIMHKLGMQQEALFKQYSKLDGHWCDEIMYGLILN